MAVGSSAAESVMPGAPEHPFSVRKCRLSDGIVGRSELASKRVEKSLCHAIKSGVPQLAGDKCSAEPARQLATHRQTTALVAGRQLPTPQE